MANYWWTFYSDRTRKHEKYWYGLQKTVWKHLKDIKTTTTTTKDRYTSTCLVPLNCSRICASWGIFLSPKGFFLSLLLLFFLYLNCIQLLRKVFHHLFLLKAEWWRKHFAEHRVSGSDDTGWQLSWSFLVVRHSQLVRNPFCLHFFFVNNSH